MSELKIEVTLGKLADEATIAAVRCHNLWARATAAQRIALDVRMGTLVNSLQLALNALPRSKLLSAFGLVGKLRDVNELLWAKEDVQTYLANTFDADGMTRDNLEHYVLCALNIRELNAQRAQLQADLEMLAGVPDASRYNIKAYGATTPVRACTEPEDAEET